MKWALLTIGMFLFAEIMVGSYYGAAQYKEGLTLKETIKEYKETINSALDSEENQSHKIITFALRIMFNLAVIGIVLGYIIPFFIFWDIVYWVGLIIMILIVILSVLIVIRDKLCNVK